MKGSIRETVARIRSTPALEATSWYSVGSFTGKALSFAFTFIFANLLTTEEFGTVSLFNTWVALLFPLITLNVFSSVQRAKFDIDEERFSEFISSITTLSLISSTIIILIIVGIPNEASIRIFGIDHSLIVLAAVVGAASNGIEIFYSIWKVRYAFQLFTKVSLLQTLAKLGLSFILILLFTKYALGTAAQGRIAGITLVDLILGGALIFIALRSGKGWFNRSHWKYALAFSIPLIPHTISGILLSQFDRILIGQMLGVADTGSYSFAYQLSEPIRYLWLATNAAWVPWFFEKMTDSQYERITHRAQQYLYVFASITAAAMIVLPIAIRFVTPSSYLSGLKIVPLVIASGYMTFLYSLYVNVEFFEKKTIFISIGTILAAVTNILINIFLLPGYGIVAAGWAALIAYLFQFLFHFGVVMFVLKQTKLYSPRSVFITSIGILAGAALLSSWF